MSWRIAAACAVGTSHATTGTPCQDRVGVELLETPQGTVLVAVVADGAGSASYSDRGAETAVDTTLSLVRAYLSHEQELSLLQKDTVAGWVSKIQDAIRLLAAAAGTPEREFACTLLVAILSEDAAAFFQIGDGAMVISDGSEAGWSYVFWPQHGEFANSTNFVTAPQAADVMEFEVSDRRIENFASFSDGIENLVLHHATKTVHEPFFRLMIQPVQRLKQPGLSDRLSGNLVSYLASSRVCERTDDDKSLVLASRAPMAEAIENAPSAS